MPGKKCNYFNCVLCSKRTKPTDRRIVSKYERKVLRKKFLLDTTETNIICNICRHVCRSEQSGKSTICPPIHQLDSSKDDEIQCSPPSVALLVPSTSKSHAYCCICKKPGPKLVVVTIHSRTIAFVKHNVLIPSGNQCCPSHINDGIFSDDCMKILQTTDSAFVNRTYILDLPRKMRELCEKNERNRLDFDNATNLNQADYISLLGLNKDNFDELCREVEQFIKNTPVRSVKTTVAIFLCKMKSGMSNLFLSTLFNVSKSNLRRAITSVRRALIQQFVPTNLGFDHLTRNDVITKHSRPLARALFGNDDKEQVILVLDGTYIFIDKSNNFVFQRRSYNMHKGRPLVKPMVIVTTSGYFVSIIGPYLADSKNNDASILNHILKTNVEDIRNWINEDDIFIVDRGFRDALPLLDSLGIKGEMPKFLSNGQKQMSTEDANLSRLVTKVRWVVEAANSRIKRWKYFGNILPTNQVPFIEDHIKIVCAISNKFCPPLSSGKTEDDEILAAKMKYLSSQVNTLKEYVEVHSLERKSAKWGIADSLDTFPHLGEEELRNLTCGSYQLKLSTSYIQEYVDGESDILVFKEDQGLIRVKIQSRHTSSKQYILWIRFTESTVIAWYCKCRAGARVVGVCSHIAAVIWYLGFARHSDKPTFGVRNWAEYVQDAQIVDQSDSESDVSVIEE